jgi:hypothetical protein
MHIVVSILGSNAEWVKPPPEGMRAFPLCVF